MSDASDIALSLLDTVVGVKEGGSRREGQEKMAGAVADAISDGHHLLVEAGPGTGKSFGYLIPAIASGKKVVVSTATKSLQDQLSERDLPFLKEALKDTKGADFTWATVKGRASYLCVSRLDETLEGAQKGAATLFDKTEALPEHLGMLAEWVLTNPSGDRDDLPAAVPDEIWSELSVSGTECAGRDSCPQAGQCFALAALDQAFDSNIVVVNHHLYGSHLMANSSILPEHHAVIFDEGHRLEDTMAATFGLEITVARLWQVHRAAGWLQGVSGDAKQLIESLGRRAREMAAALDDMQLGRVRDPKDSEIGMVFARAAVDVSELGRVARKIHPESAGKSGARARLLRLIGHMLGDLELVADLPEGYVAWVEFDGAKRSYKVAPVDVGEQLANKVLDEITTVVTSATLSVGRRLRPMARALGLRFQVSAEGVADVADPMPDEDRDLAYHSLVVPSPFDHESQGRIYVASHLPEPRAEAWTEGALQEIELLVEASGGRALVLATSYRMVRAASDRLRAKSSVKILEQGDMPKRRLVEAFVEDETSVLVATMGFWEGLDIPGRSLQLVIIDKLPFPRPDDPLWVARREAAEAAGLSAFGTVDLPRASMLLAQGAGRLIRTQEDRGVVALLDSRLVKKQYGKTLLAGLPPMPRTADRETVLSFLRRL